MSETLVITWDHNNLGLRKVASEGAWESSAACIGETEITRPTRTSRLFSSITRHNLERKLSELFEEVDISYPVWFLLPQSWSLKFQIRSPEIKSTELIRAHILWEARQRVQGDLSAQKVLIPTEITGDDIEIRSVRDELIEMVSEVCRNAGIDLAGVGIEPGDMEKYSFETPQDLRDADPLESEDGITYKTASPGVSPALAVGIIAATVIAAGSYYYFTMPEKAPVPEAVKTEQGSGIEQTTPKTEPVKVKDKASPAAVAVKQPEVKKEIPGVSAQKLEPQSKQPAVKSAVVSTTPVGLLNKSLPAGAEIKMAVISPMDFIVEVTGLKNPQGWIKQVQSQPGLNTAGLAGSYQSGDVKVQVIRLAEPGMKIKSEVKDINSWRKRAAANGLKVQGRSARGRREDAMAFVESLWNDLNGFSKIYFANDNGEWVVTVQ